MRNCASGASPVLRPLPGSSPGSRSTARRILSARTMRSSSQWGRGRCWHRSGCGLPAVFGLKGHSLVFDTGPAIPAEAAFLEYRERSGEVLGPELFPRPDGTTYVCAISSESALPLDPEEVAPDPGAIERLQAICARRLPGAGLGQGACGTGLLPPDRARRAAADRPGAGLANAYIATGHSVWGILNAPATGEAMAELITEGRTRAVDLSPFDPVPPAAARPGEPAPRRHRIIDAPLNPASSAATHPRGRGRVRRAPCCRGRNRPAAAGSAPARRRGTAARGAIP